MYEIRDTQTNRTYLNCSSMQEAEHFKGELNTELSVYVLLVYGGA